MSERTKADWVTWLRDNLHSSDWQIADEILTALAAAKQETREQDCKAVCEKCELGIKVGTYPIAGEGWWHENRNEHALDKCAADAIRTLPLSPPPPKQETHTADADTCQLCKRSKREIPLTEDQLVEPREHEHGWIEYHRDPSYQICPTCQAVQPKPPGGQGEATR